MTTPAADALHSRVFLANPDSATPDVGPFQSILFATPTPEQDIDGADVPGCFEDLLLDQIAGAIAAGREAYNLSPYFYVQLKSVAEIHYRHAVFHDLLSAPLRATVEAFGKAMSEVRARIDDISRLYYERQKQLWFLEAVEIYREAVRRLTADLHDLEPASGALRAFRTYLEKYTGSNMFTKLTRDVESLRRSLSEVGYSIHLEGKRITVMAPETAPDYCTELTALFAKFRQGDSTPYTFYYRRGREMNHIETSILDMVASLYPATFSALASFFSAHADFVDATLRRFDREAQFYLAMLSYEARYRRAGLPFCYPAVSTNRRSEAVHDAYDLALAESIRPSGGLPVLNSFYLAGMERILIVSGANQGGKTTFARMIGQLHYMATLGCPVAAARAQLFLCDHVVTHFERTENLATLRSTFEDELVRMHAMLQLATPSSLLIMNESFHSTSIADALFVNRKILEKVQALDMLCVSVTFLDELASQGDSVVSMVARVDPKDPAHRTFRIVRQAASGQAYAMALARKYGLTAAQIQRRLSVGREESSSQ